MSFTYRFAKTGGCRADDRVRVAESMKAKYLRQPRYNPERGGYGAIIGGCSTCRDILFYFSFEARTKLDAAVRDFQRRAVLCTACRAPYHYSGGDDYILRCGERALASCTNQHFSTYTTMTVQASDL